VKNCPIVKHNRVFHANLVLLKIRGYDVILGMDWLVRHKATVDCKQKLLTFVTPEGERLLYKESILSTLFQSSLQLEPLEC